MAEEAEENPAQDEEEAEQGESEVRKRINKEEKHRYKCRSRLEELALPQRRLILALWQFHAYHLPRDMVERVKVLLQELYAMTPEETEKYFAQLREAQRKRKEKKRLKQKLQQLMNKKRKKKQEARAYKFLHKVLSAGMEYAVKYPVPPLVSVRLRNLSDIILEQLCDLRGVETPPNRSEPRDKVACFLITVADWMAIAVEHLYYGVQLKKNLELEQIEAEIRAKEEEGRLGKEPTPAAPAHVTSSVKIGEVDYTEEMDNVEDE